MHCINAHVSGHKQKETEKSVGRIQVLFICFKRVLNGRLLNMVTKIVLERKGYLFPLFKMYF